MASFVPNHRKKVERLAKKEQELRRLIERGATRDRLLKVATEIRDGRIRVLRARQNKAHPENIGAMQKAEAAIKAIQALSTESVLAEYFSN
jgi:hypothetical protein